MSDEMGFGDILKYLKELFNNIMHRQVRRDERSDALNQVPESLSFKGFQAPMKGALHNSGGYDPTGKGSVGRPHQGVDLRNSGGSPIFPIAPGTVDKVYNDPKGGNAVVVKHDNGFSSYYAHMGTVNVHQGDQVNYDTMIGTVGATGNAKGFPHLHINVYRNGALIDPASVIPGIPPYTQYDPKKEQLWLPGAKAIADNWSLQEHLQNKSTKRMV